MTGMTSPVDDERSGKRDSVGRSRKVFGSAEGKGVGGSMQGFGG